MNESVSKSLQILFSKYTSIDTFLDFDTQVGPTFYDIFLKLVEQFSSSSFGDKTFARFLSIFFRMEYSSKYRKALWTDLMGLLHCFSMEVPERIEKYLFPLEKDPTLLGLYTAGLMKSNLQSSWLYWVAIHHLSCFLFSKEVDSDLLTKQDIVRTILCEHNNQVSRKIGSK